MINCISLTFYLLGGNGTGPIRCCNEKLERMCQRWKVALFEESSPRNKLASYTRKSFICFLKLFSLYKLLIDY